MSILREESLWRPEEFPAGRGAQLYLKEQEWKFTYRDFLVSSSGPGPALPSEEGKVWV